VIEGPFQSNTHTYNQCKPSIIIISLFQEGNILSKTAYLQYGLHKINKSISLFQEGNILSKRAYLQYGLHKINKSIK